MGVPGTGVPQPQPSGEPQPHAFTSPPQATGHGYPQAYAPQPQPAGQPYPQAYPPQPQPAGQPYPQAYAPQPQPANQPYPQAYPPQPQPAGQPYPQAYPPQPQPIGDGPWQLFPPQMPPYPPVEDSRPAARRPRFTWSPFGLVVGLLGVAVQALFTYLVSIVPTTQGQWQPALDAGKTANLLGNVEKMNTFPMWEIPLILVLPFLPLLQMLMVIVLSIPRARTVGPRLVSRARIGWVLIFGVVTAYAAAVTVVFGPPAGVPQLLLYWLGCLVVIVGIALPHRPD